MTETELSIDLAGHQPAQGTAPGRPLGVTVQTVKHGTAPDTSYPPPPAALGRPAVPSVPRGPHRGE
jgi:hypothetical protein